MRMKIFFIALLLFLPSCLQGEKPTEKEQPSAEQMIGKVIATPELDHVHALAVSPKGVIYMGYHEGLAVSYDDGNTWRLIKIGEEKLEDFMAIAIKPDNSNVIYTGGHGHGVWKSTDRGKEWKLLNKGLPSKPDIHALAVTPGDPGFIYVMVSGDEMYVSRDGGKSWGRMKTGLDTYAITALAVDPKSNRIYAGGTGTGVLISSDGGKSWSPAGKGLTSQDVTAITVDSSGKVYVGTKAGIFVSDDKGGSWKMVKELGVEAFGLNPVDPSYMVGASKTGFYKSQDGGFVWSVVFEIKEKAPHPPSPEEEEEFILISGPTEMYRPNSWEERGRDVEGQVLNAEAAFDGGFDDTSTYSTVRAQGCDSNFAAVYEWVIEKGSADPVLYYHWEFVKEVDRASIGAFNFAENSWDELYAIIDMPPMKKRSLRIPENYIGPGGKVRVYFEVVTPCSVGEMNIYDVYLSVPR